MVIIFSLQNPFTMQHKDDLISSCLFFLFFVGSLVYYYLAGKKILSIFPPLNSAKVIYRYKYASGYSTKSFFTKLRRICFKLDIVVTEQELWIRTYPLAAYTAAWADIVHKIPFDAILHLTTKGKKITIDFIGEQFEHKQVKIKVKHPEMFLSAIKLNSPSAIFK